MTANARERFFGFSDWLSFGLTFIGALLLYLITLAPDVTLGFSGIFAAGGMYAGVPHPPGYPLSTLWMWLFIKLLPFGNIAWRLAVSSAVAGAAACGIIALMVSRGGAEFLTNRRDGLQSPEDPRQQPMRAACGWAAGMIFAANGAFWQRAVIVDCWTVSILLFCIVLCLLLRWVHQPERRRDLYAAAFVYGLALTNSQIQLVFAPAIPFIVWAGDRRVGRDMFLSGFLIFMAGLGGLFAGKIPLLCNDWSTAHRLFGLFVIVGVIATGCSAGLVILTRKLFTEWKTVLSCGLLLLLGLSLYFYVPVASMTNPPMNWGYPRTAAGFAHVLGRGQYEQIHPTEKASVFARQLGAYGRVSAKEYGWPFMLVALFPVLFLRRLSSRMRGWVVSLVVTFLFLSLLMLAILNPRLDRQSLDWNLVFFSISYVVMSISLGYGLMCLGVRPGSAGIPAGAILNLAAVKAQAYSNPSIGDPPVEVGDSIRSAPAGMPALPGVNGPELSCNSVSTDLICSGLNDSVPVCGAPSGCPPPELCPLNRLQAGTSARIKQLAASPEVSHRLREMGFCEEQEIRLVSRHVNVICQVCNARLGLSRQLAESILVEPIPSSSASRQLQPA